MAIADRHQGHGVGTLLLETLVDRARARGLTWLVGDVLMANEQMLDVIRHLGLAFTLSVDEGVGEVVVDVREAGTLSEARARRASTALREYRARRAAAELSRTRHRVGDQSRH